MAGDPQNPLQSRPCIPSPRHAPQNRLCTPTAALTGLQVATAPPGDTAKTQLAQLMHDASVPEDEDRARIESLLQEDAELWEHVEVGFEPAGEWTAAKWWKKFSEVKTPFAIAIANWTKSGSETDAPFEDFIPNAATKNEKIMCRVWFYLFKGRPDILPLFHRSVPAATGFDTATSGGVVQPAAASGKRKVGFLQSASEEQVKNLFNSATEEAARKAEAAAARTLRLTHMDMMRVSLTIAQENMLNIAIAKELSAICDEQMAAQEPAAARRRIEITPPACHAA